MPAYTLVVHMHAKPDCVEKLAEKLKEASQIYSKDKECLDWFVMQDHKDPKSFTIVERYQHESSQKYLRPLFASIPPPPDGTADDDRYHLENPYWKTFDPYVIPLLDREMDLRRNNELDTSKEVRIDKGNTELWEAVKKHQTY